MKVKSLKESKKKNYYNVILDNNESYLFSTDVILKYRLVDGKEIDNKILKESINLNNISDIYNKASSYAIKYMKSKKEIFDYILEKGYEEDIAYQVIDKLIDNKIIDDEKYIKSYIYSYIINSNGINMIREKLYQKGYKKDLIEKELLNLDYDLYYEYLLKLYNKIKNKYDKYDSYIRINKIKAYLYQRGYNSSDIETINF